MAWHTWQERDGFSFCASRSLTATYDEINSKCFIITTKMVYREKKYAAAAYEQEMSCATMLHKNRTQCHKVSTIISLIVHCFVSSIRAASQAKENGHSCEISLAAHLYRSTRDTQRTHKHQARKKNINEECDRNVFETEKCGMKIITKWHQLEQQCMQLLYYFTMLEV